MTIIHVPTDAPTITAAITLSSPGDTIVVSSGIFNEHVIINKPNLTLLGAQANVDARTRTFIPANESIITFALPTFGTGIVNIAAPNIIFNGFTVQGNIINSTSAIYAGDAGQFLPYTTTLDVTGLQILNCIVQNNANGIMISSIEPTPKSTNYLVSQCYFYNNSGDPLSGDGQGLFFNNSASILMTNIVIQNNLFNGLETSASINLANVSNAMISGNVMNQDNSIGIFGTNNVTITNNITFGATGVTPSFPINIASAIFLTGNNTNLVISHNLIYNATNNGIAIIAGSNTPGGIMITDNCIVGNTNAGIHFEVAPTSGVVINNNNISQNTIGLLLEAGTYTIPPLLDATNNYWGSPSGPNYNGGGPGTGSLITDTNIPATVSVTYTPFLTAPNVCPFSSALTLTKTTPSVDIKAGGLLYFTVTITVPTVPVSVSSFVDYLPMSEFPWAILSQTPINLFTINGPVGSQTLNLTPTLPTMLTPGTYTVT